MLGSLIRKMRLRLPHYAKPARLAAALGCSREHYRRIESGTGYPSETLMEKIIEELEVSRHQADGLWISWGLERVPRNVRESLQVVDSGAHAAVSASVVEELRFMYDLSPGDEDSLGEIIEITIKSRELPWHE